MKFMIEEHDHNKEELKRTHAQRIKEVFVCVFLILTLKLNCVNLLIFH